MPDSRFIAAGVVVAIVFAVITVVVIAIADFAVDLIEHQAYNIGADAMERVDDSGNAAAAGLTGAGDDDDSVDGGGHLEGLGEAEERRRVEDDQIVGAGRFFENAFEAAADQVGGAARDGAGSLTEY